MKQSFIFLADGFEEIEALATADVLRRAGMKVSLVSIYDNPAVKGAHGIEVGADTTFGENDYNEAEWLIFPGGMPGAKNLYDKTELINVLKKHFASGGRVAAICASPAVVLAQAGILDGLNATCYPGFENILTAGGANYKAEDRVVTDGNVITANGPSSSLLFGVAIVTHTHGRNVAQEVADGMLI